MVATVCITQDVICAVFSTVRRATSSQLVQCLPRVLALQDQIPSVDPLSNWYINCHGMCCPLCQKGHIKDPLLLKVKCIGFLLQQMF